MAGAVTPQQVSSHRPSYINAILIQRAGTSQTPACLQCQRRGMRPFPECRRTPGHFSGCCGNCKWRNHALRCTIRDAQQRDVESSSDDDPDLGQGQGQQDGPVRDAVRIEVRIPFYNPPYGSSSRELGTYISFVRKHYLFLIAQSQLPGL
jgi:hypothetical protein